MIPRPIVWGVFLNESPPCFEILFLAQLDDDHRVARVPFTAAVPLGTPEREAMQIAREELDQVPVERINEIARSAQLIDRAPIVAHETKIEARSKR